MRSALLDALSAYGFVLRRPALMVRFGLWPFIAAIVMVFVLGPFIGVAMGLLTSLPVPTGWSGVVILLFLTGLPWNWFAAVFAVRWHRLVLLGEDRASGLQAAFGQRAGLFLVWVCILELFCVASLMASFAPIMNILLDVLSLAPVDGGLVAMAWPITVTVAFVMLGCGAYAFLLSQIGLVYPSIAIDRPIGLKRLWRLAEGRRLRNFLTLFFVSIPPALLWTLIGVFASSLYDPSEAARQFASNANQAAAPMPPSTAEVLFHYFFAIALGSAMAAATAVALSNMYRWGADRQPG